MLKPNFISILGGLLALASLAFPWWTVSVVFDFMGIVRPGYMSLYLFRPDAKVRGYDVQEWSANSHLDLTFGWITLALVVFAGLLGIYGGLFRQTRIVQIGGLFAIASMVVFVVALQTELMNGSIVPWGFSVAGIFSSDTLNRGYLSTMSYAAYLSFGFWITLAATIELLVSTKYHN